MASAAVHAACLAFLVGDGGDVRTAVNAEQAGLLASGSVFASRDAAGALQRQAKVPDVAVEVVPAGRAAEVVGIGVEEVSYAFLLRATVRRKAGPDGAAQLAVAEDVCRALLRRYRGATNLALTASGAAFVRAAAELVTPDRSPESAEMAQAVVRVTLTFAEAQASNN